MSGWIQAAMQQNTNDYIENHGLGTHNDKMYAKSSTGNTTSTPQFIWPICMLPKSANFWVIFEKGSHHMSIVHDTRRGSDTF